MRRLLALSVACLSPLAWCAPPALITCQQALSFAGENTAAGHCMVRVVPAPGLAAGTHTLEVRFRLTQHQANDWLDAYWRPAPGLDLSGSQQQRLWIRAEQPGSWLHVKICDPDNPGGNRAALESELRDGDKPLPVGQWVPLDLELPADPKRRDNIDYLGVYIHAGNPSVPLDQDLVFYLGQFPFELPPRPAWPPVAAGESVKLQPVLQPPFAADGTWMLVKDENNQTDHPARLVDGAILFDADANGWNEFLWSDPGKLVVKPLTTYRLQFDYEILRGAEGEGGSYFYSLVRAKGTIRDDVGWARWSPPTGSTGTRIITFTTHDMPDYYLNFGIRNHGMIRLSNLSLNEVLAGKGGAQ